MSSVLNRIKKIGSSKNAPLMENFFPTSASDLIFWNAHVVVKHKELSEPTKDDDLFQATNIGNQQGERPADKPVREEVSTEEEQRLNELNDLDITRGRVRMSKLRKKLKDDPNNAELLTKLSSEIARKTNLEASARVRDVWAQNAEASRKDNQD